MAPDTLRLACEALVRIAVEPAVDGRYDHLDFPYGGLPLGDGDDKMIHRCLSAPDAQAKLCAIEQLAGCPPAQLLSDWDCLSVVTLQGIEHVVLSLDPQERREGAVCQPEDWCRLDELLYRLVVRAWYDGSDFAPAPRPTIVSRQIGITTTEYRDCLQRLREQLAQPTWEGCQPRVDLWLGDPPRDELGAQAPRLWLSGRCRHRSVAEAAARGLLPANTPAQAHAARVAIYRRWLARDDEEFDEPFSEKTTLRLTHCRRCGKGLRFDASPSTCRHI